MVKTKKVFQPPRETKLDYKNMKHWKEFGSGNFSLIEYYKTHLDAAIKYKR